MPVIHLFDDDSDGSWGDGDWADGGDSGDENYGEGPPESDYPGEEYPGGGYPGQDGPNEGLSDHDWGDHESFEDYFEGDQLVGTTTFALDKTTADEDRFNDFDDWGAPNESFGTDDSPNSSPHSGQATLSPSVGTSTVVTSGNGVPWSEAKYSLQASNGVGWGGGYAYLVGPSAALQYQVSLGTRDTEIGVNAFLGVIGMGGFLAPPISIPTFTATAQFSPRASNVAHVNIGCVRSILVVLPFVSLQTSETEYGSGVLNDVSLSIGATFGLGVFGGVSCSATLRSPSR